MRATHIWLVGAALACAVSIPLPYLASPSWAIVVVDDSGSPIEGMTVRRVYQNYSTEGEDHSEDQLTDKQGYASFPARWSSSSIARRFVFTLLSARAGVNASFGRHAHVFAFGKGREGYAVNGPYVTDWTGNPPYMKSRIRATPIRNPRQNQLELVPK